MTDIDFVMLWVDGNDPDWRAARASYADEDASKDSGEQRYRDWGLLKYWFRAVEACAPWVRKVHFVTCGQIPEWLNTDNPKLHLVDHGDFIPGEWLPTFSSRPIELNIHHIEGLADQFVYFNDDMFLGRAVLPEDFFQDGLPLDLAALNVFCYTLNDPTQLVATRAAGVANKHFDMRETLSRNRGKWFTLKAGKYLSRTIILSRYTLFPGFVYQHCAQPYLKRTFQEVWEAEPHLLATTCSHRFRSEMDVNQWVMKAWQLASGTFAPARARDYRCFFVDGVDAARQAAEVIRAAKTPHLCLNDFAALEGEVLDECIRLIRDAFEARYPKPSSFELLQGGDFA